MLIELQLTKIGAVERISLKAHGLRSVANSSAYAFFRVIPWLILLLLPTVAYASGSDFRVFPWLILLLLTFSVFFRVIPWLILMLLPTVAYASGSVFRVFPCFSVANSSASANRRFRFRL
jgi:hypothetical protein